MNDAVEVEGITGCRDSSGPNNGHWKGGRSYHKAGYLMVRDRAHPRAGPNGYIFEHILVMESVLGRQLWPDENVHHRNGVRDDNRPENLELWIRPQPPGIRVDDAIAWARQVLARYDTQGPDTLNNAHPEG